LLFRRSADGQQTTWSYRTQVMERAPEYFLAVIVIGQAWSFITRANHILAFAEI
jgi:hypothetical protein